MEDHVFEPISVDTLCMWGPSSLRFLKELGSKLNKVLHDPRSGYWLRQRLSVCVARGNSASILGCLPHCEELEQFLP